MDVPLKFGLTHTASTKVDASNTATRFGSGLVDVFATPAMIALMERASTEAVQPLLPPGFNTVGVEVMVKHTKATPVGMAVECQATLVEIDGNRLVFNVVAHDEVGEIGRGTHTRYIVETERFMAKLQPKK